MAPWRSGYARVCKTLNTGSIPVGASIICMKTTRLAGAVIPNQAGEILLIHRILGREQWEVPGGKILVDKRGKALETADQAARREAKEELGIDIVIERELASSDFGGNQGTLFNYTWFLAKIATGTPVPQEMDRHDNVGYIDIVNPPEGILFSSGVEKLQELILTGTVKLVI